MKSIGRLLAVGCLLLAARATFAEPLVARPPKGVRAPTVQIEVGLRGHNVSSAGFITASLAEVPPAFDGYVAVRCSLGAWQTMRVQPGRPQPASQLVSIGYGDEQAHVRWLNPAREEIARVVVPLRREQMPTLRAVIVSDVPALATHAADRIVGVTPAEFERYASMLGQNAELEIDLSTWPALGTNARTALATAPKIAFFGDHPSEGFEKEWLLQDLLPARWEGRWVARDEAAAARLSDGTEVLVERSVLITGNVQDPAQIMEAAGMRLRVIGLVSRTGSISYGFDWAPFRTKTVLRTVRIMLILALSLLALLALRLRNRVVNVIGLTLLAASLVAAYAWPPRRIRSIESVTSRADESRVVRETLMTTVAHAPAVSIPRSGRGDRRYFVLDVGTHQPLLFEEKSSDIMRTDLASSAPIAVTAVEQAIERRAFEIPVARLEGHELHLPAAAIDEAAFADVLWECGDHIHGSSTLRRKNGEWVVDPAKKTSNVPYRLELQMFTFDQSSRPLADRPTYWVYAVTELADVTQINMFCGPIGTSRVARFWFDNPRVENGVARVGAIPANGWPRNGELEIGIQVASDDAPPSNLTLRGSRGEITLQPVPTDRSSYWDLGWDSGCPPAPMRFASVPAAAAQRLLAPGERLQVLVNTGHQCPRVIVRMKPAKKGAS